MDNKLIDLHLHSYYSDDGEFSPTELVEKCKDCGIKVMAIADHNCVRANSEAMELAISLNITYIPAIEIDCTFQNVNFHVLGYKIDYKSKDFDDIEKNIERQSSEASQQMLILTQKLGFEITEDEMVELSKDRYWKNIWTGEMFAELLLNKPEYQNHPLLKPYRSDGARGDNPYVNFYWDYYSQDKPCYTKIEYPKLEQIVEIIHKNNGYAVLAHPGINLKSHNELLKPIINVGIDGLEAFSSYHSSEQASYFYNEAKSNGIFATSGSDYHGKTKPAINIGGHGCSIANDEMSKQLKLIN